MLGPNQLIPKAFDLSPGPRRRIVKLRGEIFFKILTMRKWMKHKIPGVFGFFADFFDAMNNRKSGHSLRKWLAVGFYWLMWLLSLEFTTPENLVAVLTIHAGMITALVITYTAGNVQERKIDKISSPKETEEQ